MQKRINKHVYTWVGTFLFGLLGVDRFMRGQIGLGILKLIIGSGGVWIFGLGGVWGLIDWIIALIKLGKYEKDFVFLDGKWSEYHTAEAEIVRKEEEVKAEILRKENEIKWEKERQEQEQREKEKRGKYKKDILSGVISFDDELQKIEDEFSKYKASFRKESSEILSMAQECTNQMRTGRWDPDSVIADKIKNAPSKSLSGYIKTNLSDLREIKQDVRIEALEGEIWRLEKELEDYNKNLSDLKFGLMLYR